MGLYDAFSSRRSLAAFMVAGGSDNRHFAWAALCPRAQIEAAKWLISKRQFTEDICKLGGKINMHKQINDPYHRWAAPLSDEAWAAFLAGTPHNGHMPPPLPPDEFQRVWTGNAGLGAIREAVAFCRLIKETCRLDHNTEVIDIGCGWGRIYRALLRETPNIIGIDPVARCIELCRQAFPKGRFELSPPRPPWRFADCSFDLASLYSVFSHLNEPEFRSTLAEIARIPRPGGFLAFTTLPPTPAALINCGFPDDWQDKAAAGEFLFSPTGGGDDIANNEVMPPTVWGWVHISPAYLERILPEFNLDMLVYVPNRLEQAFIALQKR
jgi:SAM-dependent methyltransferase